ncbi:MAG: hypothetical protein JST00_28015 [Deltaproteobacteria bacterium]|nr:hypothetical protein [Deltaproteobacteria bacterium]
MPHVRLAVFPVASAVTVAAVLFAGACTGEDPVLPSGADSGASDSATDGASLTDVAVPEASSEAGSDGSLPSGERYACPSAKPVPRTGSERAIFEPSGLIVDGSGRLVAWEESRSKRRAVPENPSAGASRVLDCCASFAASGALAYTSGSELEVGGGAAFALHTLVRRTTGGASSAGGGAMVVKKPTASFPFTGFALTVAGRDPTAGLEDKPAFQLRYDPRIAAVDTTPFPTGVFVNFSGVRTETELVVQIGTRRIPGAYDNLDVGNRDPMFIGGGGDNHFVGEVCAVVLEVGDQSASEVRSNAIGAYRP